MEFLINNTALLRGLQSIKGVIAQTNTIPILYDFLFDIREQSVVITASNLEITVSIELEIIKSDKCGMVGMPAKILVDTIRTFGDIPLKFTIDETDPKTRPIILKAGKGKYKFIGHIGNEYPTPITIDSENKTTIDSAILLDGISKTLFAVSDLQIEPIYCGVNFKINLGLIEFCATTRNILSYYKSTDITSDDRSDFTIQSKILSILKTLLPNDETQINIKYNKSNVCFEFNNYKFTCLLTVGNYINYKPVIALKNNNILTIDRVSLISSLKRTLIYSMKEISFVKFDIDKNRLIVSAEDKDFNNDSHELLDCNYDDENMFIGFSTKQLLDILNVLDSEMIEFQISFYNKPIIIREVENENIITMVMPVMLNMN